MTAKRHVRIGISACLLGDSVRWDGGHKRDDCLVDALARFVEFVPICPEVEVGMGVPRESVRLVQRDDGLRMLASESGIDWTAKMRGYGRRRLAAIAKLGVCGYVLKQDSPSCGIRRVRVHASGARVRRSGTGLFARMLIDAFPHLPVEEEGRLRDPDLREHWIERVFALRRLEDLYCERWGIRDLQRFHTAHELQIMAHAPNALRRLSHLVGDAGRIPRSELRQRYRAGFMSALEQRATPGRASRQSDSDQAEAQ